MSVRSASSRLRIADHSHTARKGSPHSRWSLGYSASSWAGAYSGPDSIMERKPMSRRMKNFRHLGALVVALALFAAACGDDTTTTTTAAGATTTTAGAVFTPGA